ncbi:MAG: CBS domain-containing protein [Halapricum sp.]
MNGDVTVREAMTRDYVGVSESDSIVETAALLLDEDSDSAVVLRGQNPIGMVTARDLLSRLVEAGDEGTVADCMSTEVPEVPPEQSIEAAVDKLFARSVAQLLVVDSSGELLGILTQRDIVAATTLTPSEAAGDQVAEPARIEDGETDGGEAMSEQGICERCGALTADLVTFNGQSLCADCRDV